MADCFILTFRAIARASKFDWSDLSCRVEGILERVEGVSQFTRYTTYATLTIPAAGDAESALTLLENAEHGCLVAKSLKGEMPCSSPSGAMPSWPSINPKPVLRKRSASPPWTTGGIVGINLAVRIFELTTNDG